MKKYSILKINIKSGANSESPETVKVLEFLVSPEIKPGLDSIKNGIQKIIEKNGVETFTGEKETGLRIKELKDIDTTISWLNVRLTITDLQYKIEDMDICEWDFTYDTQGCNKPGLE